MTTEIVKLDEFKAWLVSKKSDDVVGYSNNPCDCPIARFLSRNENLREHYFSSLPTEIKYFTIGKQGAVNYVVVGAPPFWAKCFMAIVDGLKRAHFSPITASEALMHLGSM